MSTNAKRRTYRRLGVVLGAIGLLVVGTMLGLIGDEDPTVLGFVGGGVMVAAGVWSVLRSQRVGGPHE